MITTGGEGKVPPRKRMRGKIGNSSTSPEIKNHNLEVVGADTPATFYNSKTFKGIFINTDEGVWYPRVAKWPVVGTGVHERVGNKIRVKFLRLKGFVAYSPYLITQVRYRIVLYRCKTQDTFSHNAFIAPMYHYFQNISSAGSVDTKQDACCKDFYCAFFNKDYMKDHEIKRRVLFRGMIKPQADVPNYKFLEAQWIGELVPGDTIKTIPTAIDGKIIGQIFTANGGQMVSTGCFNTMTMATGETNVRLDATSSIQHVQFAFNEPERTLFGQFQRHYISGSGAGYDAITLGNQRGYFPIDVTVAMNDNVDCSKYSYVFVIESDWCIGQDPSGNFGLDEARSNFFIRFVPHIYYTDD